jgi:hypothetical protein
VGDYTYYVGGDHAEFADDQFVYREVKEVFDVFLKVLYGFEIVVVGIVPHADVGMLDDVFEETESVIVSQREGLIFVGNIHDAILNEE